MPKAQIVLGTIVLVWLAGGSPARADYDYPWCIQDAEYGYPGDCAYQTREQCLQSVSGQKGSCSENPRLVLNRPAQPPARRRPRLSPN
ncbi:DUF3551 domain-containing protein [Bradyrhizobium commune]|uniref:DUF3551 domain-containing protein n=1 Tax=Bradyrhizobium commune TaxID=83627 RepID=A0A7S9D5V3_9BRAD|nr:DUF3551 domain-containing protein [Bradyrhizobium commune]QPF91707.1 DUF3551 domain-containing protein [Bradyrhizobium commune]